MPSIKKLNKASKHLRWGNTDNKVYSLTRWVKFRKRHIERQLSFSNLECAICKVLFVHTKDIQCDHITPIAKGGQIYDHANIQLLCRTCHTRKTNKERYDNLYHTDV